MEKPSLLSTISSVFGFGYSENQSSARLQNSTQILHNPIEPGKSVQSDTENSFLKVTEREEYSLATAQWTPQWPKDLEKMMKSNTNFSYQLSSDDITGPQTLFSEEQHCDYSIWTLQCLKNDLEAMDSAFPGTSSSRSKPSDDPYLGLTPHSRNSSRLDLEPGIFSFNGQVEEMTSPNTVEETDKSSSSDPKQLKLLSKCNCSEAHRKESDASVLTNCSSLDSSINEHKTTKWRIELGSNRNYIKALVNHPSIGKGLYVHDELNIDQRDKSGQWVINYDNLNYIRSQINPDVLEKILRKT